MLAMALLDQAAYRNPLPYIAACAVAGALMPPVGAAMRARWAIITGGGRNLERAYSLDAATEETLFTAGPLLTGVAVTAAGPVLPMLVTAALLAAGCVLLAGSGAASAREPRPGGLAGPLAVPGFRVLLAVVLTTSLGLGAIDVTITARAVADHHPGAAGYILAAASLGSALGGLAWGRRRHQSRASSQMTVAARHHGGRHRAGRHRTGSAAGRRRDGAHRNRSRPVGGGQLPQRRTPGRSRRRGVNVGEHGLERRRRGRARAHRRGGQPVGHDDAAAGGRGRAGLRGPRGAAAPERLRHGGASPVAAAAPGPPPADE